MHCNHASQDGLTTWQLTPFQKKSSQENQVKEADAQSFKSPTVQQSVPPSHRSYGFVTTCSPSIHPPLSWCSSAPGVQERVQKEIIEHEAPGVPLTPRDCIVRRGNASSVPQAQQKAFPTNLSTSFVVAQMHLFLSARVRSNNPYSLEPRYNQTHVDMMRSTMLYTQK